LFYFFSNTKFFTEIFCYFLFFKKIFRFALFCFLIF